VHNPKRIPDTNNVQKDLPNQMHANLKERKHQWKLNVAGPLALYEKLERYKHAPEEVFILDYVQFKAGQARLIKAADAWFLYDAEGDPAVCQAPCIYAFKTKAAAQAARDEIGGTLLAWPETRERAREFAAEWDASGDHHRSL
jgi:hypothetical protein